jgi:ATP-binding cassette subfamily C protein
MDILRLACKSMAADFGRFVLAGLLAGALMLAPAIAVGILADPVLPTESGGMLVQTIIALVAFAVVGVLLQMSQGTAMMRLEARATTRVGAAIWDRALGLPSTFFKGFTAGDLAVRMSAFQVLRDQVSGVVANALLSIVFLLPTLGLLFFYDVTLAWLSVGIALLSLMVACAFGLLQMAPQRRRYAAARRLAGELFQFINGMSKLRSAGAEASAFAAWARGYREQHLAGMQIARLNEHLVAFSAAAPVLVGATLFAVALRQGSDQLAVGDFLVVYAVSMTFYTAVAGLGRSFEAIAAVVPGYEQVKPILAAVPDSRARGTTPANLSGDIHFDHVSFRYTDDGPLIIDDVSIRARPGEFVAIVGESGAGKSTLIRLALGVGEPTGGGVYYDGRDLAHLDRHSLRRQIGVVMQDGALRSGNILDNIIGVGDDLTIDDAWRAARLADVERDIAAMPMEMFTVVGDSSATFSGGQIQRIRIAAALVRDPRIVFLDEATSWLDARSQAQVMRGIESLAATRIVIAHRLSTIRKAERIYVLQAGRVVQEGGFDELFNADGPFHDLVQRQVI